jgi:outer membrane protein
MRRSALLVCLVLSSGLMSNALHAQSSPFPTPQWFKEVTQRPVPPAKAPGGDHLRDFVADGKLRLTLEQAIQLALANNTNVRMDELSYQNSAFSVLSAHSPFDPQLQSTWSAQRSNQPTLPQVTQTQQTGSLTQAMSYNYTQLFQTGTSTTIGLSSSRGSGGSSLFPSFLSSLNFGITQPLLRNRGFFPNRAQILIAQRNLHQSRSNFQVQISAIIQNVVTQYWNVVLARENLVVLRKSVEQAKASYDHDKRALELGALGPYDIFQSESQLASRKVSVIQAEYSLKQQEDTLRNILGADFDSSISALDIDLIESPEAGGDLLTVDAGQVIETAHKKRPEYDAQRDQLDVDDINIRLAHNQMQPSLNVTGSYSGSGLGGHLFDNSIPPVLLSVTGLGNALSQAFQFTSPTYGVTLSLNLPIRNRAAEASLGISEVNKKRDLYSQRFTEENIQLEARNAVHQLEQAKLSVAAAKISRDLALKNLEGHQRKYELGTETIFFVLDAQNQLASAEQAVIQAQVSYQVAVIAVDHATGELLEKHHVQIRDPKS